MANFVVVIDPAPDRRERFVNVIKPVLAPIDGLVTDMCSMGDFCVVWSANSRAPVSRVADDEGAAVIWGDAISQSGTEKIDAAQLKNLWKNNTGRAKVIFDGFYAGVVYHPGSGLVAGGDLLGVFPVYYCVAGDILLAGSSPQLFRYHPAFRAELNPAGLVGILLTMHMFDGHTLLEGVRRLGAGHLLLWQSGGTAIEELQYELPVSKKYFSLPFSAQVKVLEQTIDETMTRHLSGGRNCCLMLSGGLDSRMLGGYLSEKGVEANALTMGISTDLEMRCAKPVARMLGFRHKAVDVGFDQYPVCADLQAKWEHVAGGFNFIMNWGLTSRLKDFSSRVVMGHMIDAVIGTRYINWAYSPLSNTMSFETFFANANRWGIEPNVLKRLLRKEVFGDLVDETIEHIKAVYESYSELESQRAWCFNLYNRQRFHVGGSAWVLSFGAWPVVPALDHKLLECAGGMPAATIAERRAQIELVCRRFPKLAALPLDRNSYDSEPLRPRLRYQLMRYLYNHMVALQRLGNSSGNGKIERRYYFRVYDFNSPGWVAVRRQAEPYRERLFDLFNKDALNELLPGPDVNVNPGNKIVDVSSLKSLLGIMLWSKEYL